MLRQLLGREERDVAARGHTVSRSLARQSLLVAGVCLVADAATFLGAGPLGALPPIGWVVLGLAVLADGGLALPARWSGWVAIAHAVVLVLAVVLLAGTPWGTGVDDAGVLIAGYRAGAWLRGVPASLSLVSLAAGVATATALVPVGHDSVLGQVAKNALLPWLVGRYTTARRAWIDELDRLAEHRLRDEQEAVAHAVAEERSAIARDLHDVVSHHVSAVGIHAGAARLGLADREVPPAILASLAAVESSTRDALADLRRMLDLLHGDRADTTRQPGLADLEGLLDGVRRAGLTVHVSVEGVTPALSGATDIALYRAAQEMLTNAMRHGDPTAVELELRHRPDRTCLSVRNPPAAVPRSAEGRGGGRGLVGLRARAEMLDGSLDYGLVAHEVTGDRWWRTTISVPVDARGDAGGSA